MPGTNQQSKARRHPPGLFVSIPGVYTAYTAALDLVFPPRCLGCNRVDWRWCPRCQADVSALPIQPKRATVEGYMIISTGTHTGLLMDAVQALKYERATELAAPLGKRLAAICARAPWQIDLVVPVPMPAKRLAKRGYNQADVLAAELASHQQLNYAPDAIIRTRETPTQVGLNRAQRLQNVAGAFTATIDLADQHILLIDDVFTTGATMAACADAARAAGATKVFGLTVTAAVDPRL